MYLRRRNHARTRSLLEEKAAADAHDLTPGSRIKHSSDLMSRENGEGKVTVDTVDNTAWTGTGSPSPDGLRPPAEHHVLTNLALYDQSHNMSSDIPLGGPVNASPTPGGRSSLTELPEECPASSSSTPPPHPVQIHHTSSLRSSDPATVASAAGSMANIRLYSPEANLSATEALEDALDALHALRQPFMGQFELLSSIERRSGGQGLVQFARSQDTPGEFAIKFYTHRAAFERESALYCVDALRSMMPATHEILPNDGRDGQPIEHSPTGFAWPPCIVVERGESLDEWARRETPDFITIMQVLSLAVVCCFVPFSEYVLGFLRVEYSPIFRE
jgi:hypothetical protein